MKKIQSTIILPIITCIFLTTCSKKKQNILHEKQLKVSIMSSSDSELNIHDAAIQGNISAVQDSISKGININLQDAQKYTPLARASYHGHLHIVKYLVEKGADKNIKELHDYTPLDIAVWQNHLPIVQYLVEKNANKACQDNNGYTPLHTAAWKGYLDIVVYLLKNSVQKEALDLQKNTPLHIAAAYGHLLVVQYLVEKSGVMIEPQNSNNETPLMLAQKNNHEDVVEYLSKKQKLKAQMKEKFHELLVHELENPLIQADMKNIINYLNIPPVDWKHFSKRIIKHMEKNQHENKISEKNLDDPILQQKVNEFLEGFAQVLEKPTFEVPNTVKKDLLQFSLESLRPHAALFIKNLEELAKEYQYDAIPLSPDLIQDSENILDKINQQPINKNVYPIPEKTDSKSKYRIEKRFRLYKTGLFSVRNIQFDIEDIQENINFLKDELNNCPSNTPLPYTLQKEIQEIIQEIDMLNEKIHPHYRYLRSILQHTGFDYKNKETINRLVFDQLNKNKVLKRNKSVEILNNNNVENHVHFKKMHQLRQLYEEQTKQYLSVKKAYQDTQKFISDLNKTKIQLIASVRLCGYNPYKIIYPMQRRAKSLDKSNNTSSQKLHYKNNHWYNQMLEKDYNLSQLKQYLTQHFIYATDKKSKTYCQAIQKYLAMPQYNMLKDIGHTNHILQSPLQAITWSVGKNSKTHYQDFILYLEKLKNFVQFLENHPDITADILYQSILESINQCYDTKFEATQLSLIKKNLFQLKKSCNKLINK